MAVRQSGWHVKLYCCCLVFGMCLVTQPQFQQLNISYKSRGELERQENVELPTWVLHPHEFL
jgi:hypothetical protein